MIICTFAHYSFAHYEGCSSQAAGVVQPHCIYDKTRAYYNLRICTLLVCTLFKVL